MFSLLDYVYMTLSNNESLWILNVQIKPVFNIGRLKSSSGFIVIKLYQYGIPEFIIQKLRRYWGMFIMKPKKKNVLVGKS